ncbi:AraC family transcriptional regulator [Cohnella fermenti]|uniref:AraC family transcriptional regulator n=1 Tax=Cohnella fermenti TaxID=2565925 RepID=A0A4V3WF38_9BACL|nr:AraC family transcriptional regulator [Cohnella fermenti]THF78761.1 AraC family transcriptional regulator [Cohnella fermenti]
MTQKHFYCNPDPEGEGANDLYITHWGKEDCAPLHSFGPGIRDVYKFHFVHTGRGIVRVEGKTYTLTAGQAFLIHPNVVIFYQADEHDPWTYSYCGFRGNLSEKWVSRTSLTPEQPVFSMDLQVMPYLYDLLTETLAHESSRDLRLNAVMYRFLTALIELLPAAKTAEGEARSQHVYVHRAMEYIHAHYGEALSVTQLAADLGLDRKYLSAIFKGAKGLPPQQYLLRYRMRKACRFLRDSTLSVGEIARSVGYADALLFSKMFKRTLGVSPSEFRAGAGEAMLEADIVP